MTEKVIEVRDLRKSYGSFVAVDCISFEVFRGEIFGLLGPNGAGKTTTLECLEGLRQPDSGWLRVMGIDPASKARALRDKVGVQLQASGMPANITVREALHLFSAYHGIKPDFRLIDRMGLGGKHDVQYEQLSGGQKRRLALALAVAHHPSVIFLDEPTAALDVQSRVELHELMAEFRHDGITIILSTHDMAEAEKLADRVAILVSGKLIAVGTPREITATGAGLTKISVHTERATLSETGTLPGVVQRASKEGYDIFYTTDTAASIAAVLDYLEDHQDVVEDLRVERPSLEDRFLEITAKTEATA
ncbi:MAG: ABC transporter ATP-binding protein [Chloroflexi bacterium]|nr:ABC transporter ATP-binding protein [Chloroflexota bacterium]